MPGRKGACDYIPEGDVIIRLVQKLKKGNGLADKVVSGELEAVFGDYRYFQIQQCFRGNFCLMALAAQNGYVGKRASFTDFLNQGAKFRPELGGWICLCALGHSLDGYKTGFSKVFFRYFLLCIFKGSAYPFRHGFKNGRGNILVKRFEQFPGQRTLARKLQKKTVIEGYNLGRAPPVSWQIVGIYFFIGIFSVKVIQDTVKQCRVAASPAID